MLIDSHCHLDPVHFKESPDDVLARARSAGVTGFVVIGVGETLLQAESAVALSERRSDVWAAVGIHPHDAKTYDGNARQALSQMADGKRVVAIGEIGLDYHYNHSPVDVQKDAFRALIGLAKEKRLPIVIHTRSAADDTLEILESENARDVGGVIHCFSEDRAFARRALDLNFDVSFSGIVTFKKSLSIQDVAAWAPADRVMVETDSPYLSPVPVRGKPCEPSYVVHTARRVAELRGISFEEMAQISSHNARRRFSLSPTAT